MSIVPMSASSESRRIVLVGAGHTNLHVVRMWRTRPIENATLTVVSPFPVATYSGMLPGTLAGLYTPDQMQIDLTSLCAASGVELIVERATGLNAEESQITFDNRPSLGFEVVSIGIGSIPAGRASWANAPAILSIKPMQTFLDRLDQRIQHVRANHNRSSATPIAVAIVGGGAAGVEVAFCLDSRLLKSSIAARISLIDSGAQIMNGYTNRTVRYALKALERRGIQVRTGTRVEHCEGGELVTSAGERLQADVVIWAAGAAPPPVLDDFALSKANDGFLEVRPTLQTTADFPAFVVGDTATFSGQDVPKAGVYAVREGDILWENLQRLLSGKPLVEYRPQKRFLSLLCTGDGRAIGEYKGLSAHGRWVWWMKDWIDRRFVEQFRISR